MRAVTASEPPSDDKRLNALGAVIAAFPVFETAGRNTAGNRALGNAKRLEGLSDARRFPLWHMDLCGALRRGRRFRPVLSVQPAQYHADDRRLRRHPGRYAK